LAALPCGLLPALTFSTASAQVYQWKDANGRTVVSDTPPPGNVAKKQRIGGPPPAAEESTTAPAPAAKAGPKSLSERDMEFKKRQQEGKEKSEKARQEEIAANEQKENCKRAREALTTLQSQQPVASVNEKG
ncbi:MAG TPA: DUF4124 domain-containing protein, partial [Rhodocyclaceae bacterium]|nr:DUF4124 domain-containing protein [Rhodocyclaceae bacterium]